MACTVLAVMPRLVALADSWPRQWPSSANYEAFTPWSLFTFLLSSSTPNATGTLRLLTPPACSYACRAC